MLAFLSLVAVIAAGPAGGPSREIDNVAAFARVYGVVRYFYPSDSAAELDWNRFAVYGVGRVRTARNAGELGTELGQLVSPLGPGIEIGTKLPAASAVAVSAEPLVAWRYLGAGFANSGPYKAKRTHRAAVAAGGDAFVTLMQTFPAETLRGKAIRLQAKVRATSVGPTGGGALWVRVDRPNRAMGFFDNMEDRMVREPEWRLYTIVGTVADDAETIALGVMSVGGTTAEFDAVELAVEGTPGVWSSVPIRDPGFEEPAADTSTGGWHRAGSARAVLSRPGQGAPEGRQFARIAPAPAGDAAEELFPEGAPKAGAHVDLDLGTGLRARIPLVLTDSEAGADAARKPRLDGLLAALATVTPATGGSDVDRRLADVVVAWNVYRHFYPYWAETGVDWDAQLRPHVDAARRAQDRAAQRDVLRTLVADVRDGHGFVTDSLDRTERAALPLAVQIVDERPVVIASAIAEVPVGTVITSFDGTPASERVAREMALGSGTPQWRRAQAEGAVMRGPRNAAVTLGLDTGSGSRKVTLTYSTDSPPAAKRPGTVVEIEPGLWYVDLTRTKMAELTPKRDALVRARAVVFDVRGYPTDAGVPVLSYLLAEPEADRWMHVSKIVGPFHETAGWSDAGWNLAPSLPRIAGKRVFLTDGSAISYAESVMGYVADRRLATIVGSTTAGTNGNVAAFLSPGGFRITFTGMKVTRHDGRSAHHLVGITPDVTSVPTLAGIRAGRDEVLEKGLEVARAEEGQPRKP